MRLRRCSTCCLSVLLLVTIHELGLVSSVVVDGEKRDDLSASKHQKHNEAATIDSFNIRTCGISDPNGEEHEFVNMAREGQFPWLVSFQIKIMPDANYNDQLKLARRPDERGAPEGRRRQLEDLHFCSGSLISDKWILSAAHCFAGATPANYLANHKLKVVAGSHKVSSRTSLNRNLTIERVYYHSRFNNSLPIGYDLALVELRERVELSQKRSQNEFGEQRGPFMNVICLPKRDNQYKFNESVRIAGWGLSQAKDIRTMPSKLLTTDILLSDRDDCVRQYAKRLKSDLPNQRQDLICASYKASRDACQSDSGGPLMQYVNQKAVAIGIVSYGIGCATRGVPGIYTRISAYIDWIRDVTTNGPNASVEFKLLQAKPQAAAADESAAATSTSRPEVTTEKPPAVEFKFFDES